jgi:hypothetical protein
MYYKYRFLSVPDIYSLTWLIEKWFTYPFYKQAAEQANGVLFFFPVVIQTD